MIPGTFLPEECRKSAAVQFEDDDTSCLDGLPSEILGIVFLIFSQFLIPDDDSARGIVLGNHEHFLHRAVNREMIAVVVIDIQEGMGQGAAYLGIARLFPFLMRTNEVFRQLGIEESGESRLTNTDETRRETGTAKQVEIFGDRMQDAWKKDNISLWLASNCFGDYYTREGLGVRDREMITFCFLLAQGGCEPQLKGHIQGNINVGNDAAFLKKDVEQMVPYIGYPRSLNAMNAIAETAG